MNCKDCIRDLLPDNPRVKTGKYNLSGCDYCTKSFDEDIKPEPDWNKKQWSYVQQLQAQIVHTNNKLNDLLDKKDKYLYDKIKVE